jgi:hypothetical protein
VKIGADIIQTVNMAKKAINGFILGAIGIIFLCDFIFYATNNDTISEQITYWINQSTTNLIIFLCVVILIVTHFVFGKYKD